MHRAARLSTFLIRDRGRATKIPRAKNDQKLVFPKIDFQKLKKIIVFMKT